MNEHIITSLLPDSRWSVMFKDEGHWRMGIYKPEFTSQEDISKLEKHSCPELFICLQGRMGLVIKNGGDESILEMEPGQALMVTEYHNGFAIDLAGYFLVVERTSFITEYIDRQSGIFLSSVEVK
jgi:hypothetical protein